VSGSPVGGADWFTMAKEGLAMPDPTPSAAQSALIRVVLPTPMGPSKVNTRLWGHARSRASATCGASAGRRSSMRLLMRSAWFQVGDGHQHLFQGNTPVLEGVAIEVHEVVVIVGVDEVEVLLGEDKRAAHIGAWQEALGGVLDGEDILGLVGEVAPVLVAQVGVGVAVADHLAGLGHAHGAVVGGDHHAAALLGDGVQDVQQRAVPEP